MKKIFLYVFLSLLFISVPSQADDIRDFQIEGMSIGDSALDYFSKDQIKKNIHEYPNNKYKRVQNDDLSFFKTYDAIDFNYKANDIKYIMLGIAGIIVYENNINDCYEKQKNIVEELSTILTEASQLNADKVYNDDIWKGSRNVQFTFLLENKDIVSVHCNDYSKEHGGQDHLAVNIKTKEFNDFLKIAYIEN